MSALSWILLSTLIGGALSVAAAAAVAFKANPARVPMLISYAIGALLGAVFLEILPRAFTDAANTRVLGATVLGGLLVFFVLEKLVLWRHHHSHGWPDDPAPHGHHAHTSHVDELKHDHERSGLLIMFGDTFHNFVDGVLIAAAFLADPELGLVTALAIIAHEVPQEVSDFLVLLHSGFTRKQALLFNVASSVAMVLGGLCGYAALHLLLGVMPYLLGFVAAGMIYVAVADLIPGLHRRPELKITCYQVSLMALGIASIWLVREIAEHGV